MLLKSCHRGLGVVTIGRGILVSMNDVTQILNAINAGDGGASEKLLPIVYQELRRLAARKLAREAPGQTL